MKNQNEKVDSLVKTFVKHVKEFQGGKPTLIANLNPFSTTSEIIFCEIDGKTFKAKTPSDLPLVKALKAADKMLEHLHPVEVIQRLSMELRIN